jgi:hypothetical protein
MLHRADHIARCRACYVTGFVLHTSLSSRHQGSKGPADLPDRQLLFEGPWTGSEPGIRSVRSGGFGGTLCNSSYCLIFNQLIVWAKLLPVRPVRDRPNSQTVFSDRDRLLTAGPFEPCQAHTEPICYQREAASRSLEGLNSLRFSTRTRKNTNTTASSIAVAT